MSRPHELADIGISLRDLAIVRREKEEELLMHHDAMVSDVYMHLYHEGIAGKDIMYHRKSCWRRCRYPSFVVHGHQSYRRRPKSFRNAQLNLLILHVDPETIIGRITLEWLAIIVVL